MSIARRGIFGLLAALPFAPKVANAAQAEEIHALTLKAEHVDLEAFRVEFEQNLKATLVRMPALFPGERYVALSAAGQHDRVEIAPYGWDTLENVR